MGKDTSRRERAHEERIREVSEGQKREKSFDRDHAEKRENCNVRGEGRPGRS